MYLALLHKGNRCSLLAKFEVICVCFPSPWETTILLEWVTALSPSFPPQQWPLCQPGHLSYPCSLCVLAVICQLGAIGVLQWQLMLFFWGPLLYFFAFWPLFYKSAPVLFQDWAMPPALSPPYFINIVWLGIKIYSVSEPTAVEQRSSSTGWHFFFFFNSHHDLKSNWYKEPYHK